MESPSTLERRLTGTILQKVFLRDRRAGPWSPPDDLPGQRVTFPGNSGGRLVGHWFPAERPRGTVILVHPDRRYGKHWFVREGWVRFLHENAYDVLTFDLTGYGESEGPATYYHEDVLSAARFGHAWAGGLPLHIVGLSMGAFATANASPHLDFVQSITLESPYPSFTAWYEALAEREGAAGATGLAVTRALGRVFPKTAASIHAEKNIRSAAARRILIAIAENDTVTPPGLSEAVADAAPVDRTRVIRIAGVEHLEPFAKSAEYRESLLATFEGR